MKPYITILIAVLFVSGLGSSCFAAFARQSADLTGDGRVDLADLAIFISQWLDESEIILNQMAWVSINDSGAAMKDHNGNPISHGGFTGQMSKYEITNAQYFEYLNAALASGDITISGDYVMGANGSNPGDDFVGEYYYNLAGPGVNFGDAWNGGAANIWWSSNDNMLVERSAMRRNHPVTYVSWYGAKAFASYYGWRLPTQWEWQAAADYDGSYTYGCGTSINYSIATIEGYYFYGTNDVGFSGTYGYGLCDMAGNVWEWTDSIHSEIYRVIRSGSWRSPGYDCSVADWHFYEPNNMYDSIGFRVCRSAAAGPYGMTWVSIVDSGEGMLDMNLDHVCNSGFTGQMSQHETTNAQYCEYLNAALAAGQITVHIEFKVYAASDTSHLEPYYDLAGEGYTGEGATNGGAARINWTGSSFTVDAGFENHPVTYVSWYGATAFASYYDWRLPTELEWQAVADYINGFHRTGCGNSMNNNIANYNRSTHPDGTTAVGAFGTYGYGMSDMAGNVGEWTSNLWDGDCVTRGGSWCNSDFLCTVMNRYAFFASDNMNFATGFRVCR